MINRRQFVTGSSCFFVAGLMPFTTQTSSADGQFTRWVLQSGLSTDADLFTACQADGAWPFSLSMVHYEKLVWSLRHMQQRQLYALLEPACSVLLDAAIRDSGAALGYRAQVDLAINDNSLRASQVQDIVRQLNATEAICVQPKGGNNSQSLVAFIVTANQNTVG